MVAVTVGCHTNNPNGSRQCRLSYYYFIYNFSLLKVIPRKTKFDIEYLVDILLIPGAKVSEIKFQSVRVTYRSY